MNVTSLPVTGPVNVGVQPSGIQKSSPPETHRQPIFLSSRLSSNSTSNALPPAPLPSSLSVSQQTSHPNLVPESPQSSLTDRQREICVVEGCTELIATNMWINHLNLHAQGLLSGTIPDAWLLEHGRVICPHCSHLVARSHIISHSTKCNQSTIPPTATPFVHTDSILPSFEDICKLQCNTIRHIPAKSRPAFVLILSSTLRSAFSVNDEISWLKLFVLPKCVLVSSKRRGHHHKPTSIGHLCNLWSQGRFDALWEHATSQATPRDHHPRQRSPRQSIITAISLAREGLYGKACQALTSTGIALNTDTTWELLQSKHPKGTPPTTPPIEALGTTILPQTLTCYQP